MRYGIAVWNYGEPGVPLVRAARGEPSQLAPGGQTAKLPLAALVEEFAGFGFDAVSFLPGQIVGCGDAEADELLSLLRERGLAATVHGNFEMTRRDVETLVARLGETLRVVSFDAAMTADSCGHFYDAPRMAAFLRQVEEATREGDVRFAVEDFPLDSRALERFRSDVGSLLGCPRYGTLIDVGHLNLRRHLADYFRRLTPEEYVGGVPLPIVEIHVHDNLGEKDSHGPLGFGNLDFGAVARGLRQARFDGVSTIEIAPSFHGSTPAESKPHARESLEAWRSVWERAAAARGEPSQSAPGGQTAKLPSAAKG